MLIIEANSRTVGIIIITFVILTEEVGDLFVDLIPSCQLSLVICV